MKKQIVVLGLILILAAILRFWHLSRNPPGLYWDEVSNGYNAYSVLKTARDEYGVFLPTVFRSYDDYKPPTYIYALVPSVATFGLDEFAVRFPSALGGVLTVLLTYLISKIIIRSEKFALFASFFLAISPWHIHFSRGGFEANFMAFLTILGLYLFLQWRGQLKLLIFSATAFGLAFNTYQGAKIWVPLFIVMIAFYWREDLIKYGKKLIIPIFIFAIFCLPVVLNFNQSFIRGKSVSIFSQNETDKLGAFLNGYFSHFSPVFLFTKGDQIGRHSVPGMGELYVFEIPLILAGIYLLFKTKFKHRNFLIAWLLLSPIPAALSSPTPHSLRAITFIPLWSIIAAYGLMFFKNLNHRRSFKVLFLAGIFLVGVFNFVTYLHLYHKHYPREKGPDWQDGHREMLGYVNQVKDEYETIAISDTLGRSYIYTLFYLKIHPKEYQAFGNQQAFGKFEFFKYGWDKKKPGEALVVVTTREGGGQKFLKDIHTYGQDVAFRIFEEE